MVETVLVWQVGSGRLSACRTQVSTSNSREYVFWTRETKIKAEGMCVCVCASLKCYSLTIEEREREIRDDGGISSGLSSSLGGFTGIASSITHTSGSNISTTPTPTPFSSRVSVCVWYTITLVVFFIKATLSSLSHSTWHSHHCQVIQH